MPYLHNTSAHHHGIEQCDIEYTLKHKNVWMNMFMFWVN